MPSASPQPSGGLATFEEGLTACDGEKNFTGVTKAFQRHVVPRLESLLKASLRKPLQPSTAPAESSSDAVNAARRLISAYDDVKYLVMRHVADIIKASTAPSTAVAPGGHRRPKRTTRADEAETLLTNVFCLLYGIKLTGGSSTKLSAENQVTLRWACLADEKRTLEKSEAYANSNAVERRAMQLKTVLAVFSDRGRRHEFSALWSAFTSADLPTPLRLHFLTNVNTHIMPYLTKPVALSDFLSSCVSGGGLTAVLALDGLLYLMLKEDLEYPSFYDKLYSLITPDAFSTKHRHQLFNLVNLALTSTRVSAEIVAAFIKRIARVLLLAPAPTLYFSLPFLRQLFQRHPNCLQLIHRVDGAEALFEGKDPFDPFATKIADSHALESTLWELCILEKHFLPAVGLMVAAYASPAQDNGALKLDKTYGRLFAQEVTRAKGEAGVIAYKAPEGNLLGPGHKEGALVGVLTA